MPEVERVRVREDMTKVKLARDTGTHPYVIRCWFNGTAIGRDDRCSFSSMLMPNRIDWRSQRATLISPNIPNFSPRRRDRRLSDVRNTFLEEVSISARYPALGSPKMVASALPYAIASELTTCFCTIVTAAESIDKRLSALLTRV
jgi:hypothetical protein